MRRVTPWLSLLLVVACAPTPAPAPTPLVASRDAVTPCRPCGERDGARVELGGVLAQGPLRPLEPRWPTPASSVRFHPVDDLAPSLRLGGDGHEILTFNDVILDRVDKGYVVHMLSTGKTTRLEHAFSAVRVVDGLLLDAADMMTAYDLRAAGSVPPDREDRRWFRALDADAPPTLGRTVADVVGAHGHLVASIGVRGGAWQLVGLDAATGVIAWRAPLPRAGGEAPDLAVVGERVVRWDEDAIVAASLATGAPVWSVAAPRGARLVASGDRVVGVYADTDRASRSALVVAASDGRVVRRAAFAPGAAHVELEGRDLVRLIEAQDARTITVESTDVDTGVLRWRVGPFSGWARERPLLVDADAVFFKDGLGTLRALDRATGTVRWWWRFPLDPEIAIARPAPDAEGVLVADDRVFARKPGASGPYKVHLTGHVTTGAHGVASVEVVVDRRWQATTDANGVYAVDIVARGRVDVDAIDHHAPAPLDRSAEGIHTARYPTGHASIDVSAGGALAADIELGRTVGIE